jgi:hypothetical protein
MRMVGWRRKVLSSFLLFRFTQNKLFSFLIHSEQTIRFANIHLKGASGACIGALVDMGKDSKTLCQTLFLRCFFFSYNLQFIAKLLMIQDDRQAKSPIYASDNPLNVFIIATTLNVFFLDDIVYIVGVI